MDPKEPQFDADGRDPQLIELFEWLFGKTGHPLHVEDVPRGVPCAEWWKGFLAQLGPSRGLPYGETARARGEDGTTTSQRWMLHKYGRLRRQTEMLKDNVTKLFPDGPQAEAIGGRAAVNRVLKHYIDELAQQCGEDDPYVVYMRSTLTAEILPFPPKAEPK